MEVLILPTPEEVGRVAADRITSVVRAKPGAVLGLATGSSPQAIYAELARRVRDGSLDLALTRAFALDEYVGLPVDHPQSYAAVIARDVVGPLGMDPQRVRVPDGLSEDVERTTAEYELAIARAGGIDIQLLGIGANGHIGFNEPTSSLASRTRIKTLAPQTRADNARFFASLDEVPMHCITQGLGTILDARELLLVAQGEGKADAVAHAVEGPVSSMWPASALQLHPHATVILDEPAASRLALADYYRYTAAHKPPAS
ncbi:glucosamine-6-phosphate deaminase [Compostimonas suwonensis]|uniref:Glucosamine-6-phosphate deaminase n=1 Tax=Compostimonas suwonensis TaxID=1048394 RepID=A0A2M9BVC7_9MICO|nr:glucosamine-6-phosphate deaminase [Compostimonas suwonensis]PJJ61907.1 glucosamine-6-phosphate deaminase [Compostimonas suwonensis]